VPTFLGAHNPRVDAVRELLTKKGRKQHGRFSFEGATLLQEAHDAGVPIEALYVTKVAYGSTALAADLERSGTDVYLVDERVMRRISDVETPSGIVAIAPLQLQTPEAILQRGGVILLLADVNDPGNAGTLLRTAEAFGISGVLMGSLGAEPHLPKVVRSAMGSLFRVAVAVAGPQDVAGLLGDRTVTGLAAGGEALSRLTWGPRSVVAVGNERHGLGRWQTVCTRFGAIPMAGKTESLNAAVAGSIALYEATKHPPA
jgi:RNA methyltransferase, TrmH family